MKPVEVKQHDDGTWYARPYLGTNKVTGKPIRPYKRFPEAADEDEALEMARDWARTLQGAASIGTTMKVGEVLARYIDECSPQWSVNTAKSYRTCLNWVEPVIGDIDVDELRPYLVEAAYNVLLARGGARGGALSPATVRQVHEFLCGAFKWMVRGEIAPFNPMPSVEKPRLDQKEAVAYCESDFAALVRALARALSDDGADGGNIVRRTVCMAAYLSLNTGERVGEICANSVSDAQVLRRQMHVGATVIEPKGRKPERQTHTKGRKSRNVSLGNDVCERIKDHFSWQKTWLPARVFEDPSRPICCGKGGELLRPSVVSRRFKDVAAEIGLSQGTTFHTLRHTHATMLIAEGADMRTVQERLGHANVSTTLSLYAHVVPGRDQAAAAAFEDLARRIGGDL